MILNLKFQISNSERGVSLIITFFIMIIILAIVLSVSTLLYSEIKVMRNLGNSMISLYAADSGIEKVLYYDRQVLLVIGPDGEGNPVYAPRGLCSMLDPDNIDSCQQKGDGILDPSVYCNPTPGDPNPQGDDCYPASCTDCTISFETKMGDKEIVQYSVNAKVDEENNLYSDITSSGTFGGAGRKIKITAPFGP